MSAMGETAWADRLATLRSQMSLLSILSSGWFTVGNNTAFKHPTGLVLKASWNVMAHAQKPNLVFRPNGRVRLNRRGGVSSVDYWQPRCAHQRQ